MWSVKFEVWSAKSAVCSVRCGVSREGHGRDRLSLNYRSFMFGKLPPPACPGLCYTVCSSCYLLRSWSIPTVYCKQVELFSCRSAVRQALIYCLPAIWRHDFHFKQYTANPPHPHPLNHGFSGRGTPICNLHFLGGGWGGRKCNLQPPKISKIPGFGTTLDDIGRRANRSNMLSANGRSGNIQLERGTFDWCS